MGEISMGVRAEVNRQEQCALCGWHGQALAVVRGTFVHWACPRRHARHTGLLPGKTVPTGESKTPVASSGETSG